MERHVPLHNQLTIAWLLECNLTLEQHIPVMNVSDEPYTLHKGAQIGNVFLVTSLKQAQELLQTDPRVLDWGDEEFPGYVHD